jgi:hypothetical protein
MVLVFGTAMKKEFVFFTVLSLFCVIYGNAQNNTQPVTHIYIAGSYMDGNTERACYWVDGMRIELNGGKRATGIAVEHNNVYVAGYINNSDSDGCYWVNGAQKMLNKYYSRDDSSRHPRGIAVSGGKVYVVGYCGSDKSGSTIRAVLWVDGQVQGLRNTGAYATGIVIENGATYISGYDYKVRGNLAECQGWFTAYGQSINLDSSWEANGIAVLDGSIYVAGHYNYSREYGPCYWVDGIKNNLPGGGASYAKDIAVANGTIYVIGRFNYYNDSKYEARYWVNGRLMEFPNANASILDTITVFDGKVYITGTFKQGVINVACYWVNGERTIIPNGRTITGIVVVTE